MAEVQNPLLPKDAKPEEVKELYDNWAEKYDGDISPVSTYPALNSIITTLLEVIDTSNKDVRIIDLGAGTGHAAIELKKYGFTNIDGLDLSPAMLKKAKEKNAYKNYICEAVTEKRLDIPSGSYDIVLSVGAITSGYIKANAFDEILRLVKPGGYVFFTIRKDTVEIDEYEFKKKFEQFISEGKWKEVKKYETDYLVGFHKNVDKDLTKCYVMVFKVLKNE